MNNKFFNMKQLELDGQKVFEFLQEFNNKITKIPV